MRVRGGSHGFLSPANPDVALRTLAWAQVDRGTRAFWRVAGRPVDLTADPWLEAPSGGIGHLGDAWIEGEIGRGRLVDDRPGAGLLAAMANLDGHGFDSARLHPQVRDFYEHTSRWRMDAWLGWSPWLAPGGAFIAWAFGRRVQQLAIPVRPLDVSRGIDSQVRVIRDEAGRQLWAGWLRRLVATGDTIFSGAYRSTTMPGHPGPVVQVAFPLEQGSVQVLLAPSVGANSALVLTSSGGAFGAPGAYVTVLHGGRLHAARVPIHETFTVFVDAVGELRTDHHLSLGAMPTLRLHYRMTPAGGAANPLSG